MGGDYRLNATAASLLGFLHEGSRTGWELVRDVDRRLGDFWSITRSQVYRELQAMAEAGLIVAGPRGARDRRPFTLTDAGRAAFQRWAALTPVDETTRIPLLLMVTFGRHVPADTLARHLAEHRTIHEERLRRYQAEEAAVKALPRPDAYALATLAFGIGYERAVVDWFDGLPETIGVPGPPNQNGGA